MLFGRFLRKEVEYLTFVFNETEVKITALLQEGDKYGAP